jgi:trehalose-phosphatase
VTDEDITAELRAAINRLAKVPQLLVACDYDGTLAELVEDPTAATPLPESVAAVRSLASLPQTWVAVVSGRALRDLATLSRLPAEIFLVGSHGSEFDIGFVERMEPDQVTLRDRLYAAAREVAAHKPGVRLEIKPASVAVHTRTASRDVAAAAIEALRAGPATWPGVTTTTGKEVLELSVISTHKGTALDTLRMQFGTNATLFVGDDVTDENAFAQLHGPDVGVRIGAGETKAQFRVPDPRTAARLLGMLLEARRAWLYGERAVPIERHSMLANGNTIALLAPDATVTWLCHPSPDASSVFSDLLGGPDAGRFSVGLADRTRLPLGQRYRTGTMTVETRWSGLTVTDFMDCESPGNAETDPPSAASPPPTTALVRVLTGSVKARLAFAPRPEFGQVPIKLQPVGDGLLVLGSNEPIALHAPGVEWNIEEEHGHDTARAVVDLASLGGRLVVELRCGTHNLGEHRLDLAARQEAAEQSSRQWAAQLMLPTIARDLVQRSALTLRGLCHRPTGAILAAATTSLPEELGGVRNWDYRYCWLRDAAMTARALVDLGSIEEAEKYLSWVAMVTDNTGGHPERLHPIYSVNGGDLSPEAVIENLPGYAGSRPVRVGNAANRQVQLDVFGPIADLIWAIAQHRPLTDADVALIENMVAAVQRRWHEPDHGIWEARQAPRHHVYSKVMCWQTVDRAIKLVEQHDLPTRPGWTALRQQIADHVLTHGWNEKVGAYTVAYDSDDLDAASLWIGLAGLLPDDDPRFLATVLAVEAELRNGPTVYRYLWDDGLPGREGGFHICTTWLVEAYLRTGRRSDAEELFNQYLDLVGPTGLLPEQYDSDAERHLGNHPQAYSHIGLIRCALLLDSATA